MTTAKAIVSFQAFHFVVQIREIDTDVVIEVLANLVVPVQGEVDTGIQNLSVVARQQLATHRELG